MADAVDSALVKGDISPQTTVTTSNDMSSKNLDPYDDDEVEHRYLQSKPTCFLVLGKPGSGKTQFASKLAQQWRCQLVNANQVITEAIQSQTEMGKMVEEILLRGESISEELATKLVEEKIKSPEVAHHGYVLDDFPCVSEEFLTVKQQFDFIKSWPLKPDFILHLKVHDVDLERRRIGQRVDPVTGIVYTKDAYDPKKPQKKVKRKKVIEDEEEEEEEEEPEEEEEEEEADISSAMDPETVGRLIKRPEDLQPHVINSLHTYKTDVLRTLEEHMADHNQQSVFKLDANKSPDILIQETIQRLSCFQVNPVSVPIRLVEPETEEEEGGADTAPDSSEPDDELFRSLGGKSAPNPRFRWRRSKWQRVCPVALAQGNILPGRADLAVGFLDKLYFLSSEEALAAFMKNPRLYIAPPQPRPPCKLIVTGPPMSGKTTLSNLLAEKYGATVLNIAERMDPKLTELKVQRRIEITEEATKSAMIAVRARLEEEARKKRRDEKEAAMHKKSEEEAKLKMERAAQEQEEEEEDEEEEYSFSKILSEKPPELEEKDPKLDDEIDKTKVSSSAQLKSKESKASDEEASGEQVDADRQEIDHKPEVTEEEEESTEQQEEDFVLAIEVSENHPDVVQAVEDALEAANFDQMQLSPEMWMDELEEATAAVERELRRKDPKGPLHGGWILDNFPETKEQWSMMFEREKVMPDSILTLQDNSRNGDLLINRWSSNEKEAILEQIRTRVMREREERQQEEEEKLQQDEDKSAEEMQKQSGDSEEQDKQDKEKRQQSSSSLESELLEKSSSEQGILSQVPNPDMKRPLPTRKEEGGVDSSTQLEDSLGIPLEIPMNSPEVSGRRELLKKYDREWTNIVPVITGNSSLEPFNINLFSAKGEADDKEASAEIQPAERSESELVEEAVKYMEKIFAHQAWERTPVDIDEEEGGGEVASDEEEEQEEEEGEESEEVDPNRSAKKFLGDTSFFCPVALKEKGVLWPGDPEFGAKFREKIYYLTDADARERFLADPASYLSKDKPSAPPPLRLLMLGPRGAGKTTHGRSFAKKHRLFHIQFNERLQELVIGKTKKKVVPEREEEPEEVFSPEEEIEEPGPAVVDSGGSKMITEDEGTKVQSDSNLSSAQQSLHSSHSHGSEVHHSTSKVPSISVSEPPELQVPEELPEAVPLTEEEEAIVAYLRNDEPLSAEFLHKFLDEWWHKEPYKSTGFILEGFPNSAEEAAILGEHGFYPDAAVIFNVEDSDVVARLLPEKMDRWRQRRQRKLAHKQKVKERKKAKRDKLMKARREELMHEAEVKKQERMKEKQKLASEGGDAADDDEDDDEEDEEEDFEAKLAEEFEEEEEEEEEEETEEDARERIQSLFTEIYESDSSKIASATEKLTELMIPIIEIDAGRRQPIVRYTLNKNLKQMVEYRESMFERVYPISERLAEKMLKSGYKQISRFGRWCPVKLLEGAFMQPRHGPGFSTFPVIHRGLIYFLSSQEAKEEFMRNPLPYLCQPSPKTVLPIRMAIIGPPKSGKTTLAKRFAEDFGLMRLSIGEAIRSVLANQPNTELARCIELYLYQGLTVPDECAVQALEVTMMDVQCQTRGYILDGYPVKKIQVDFMEQRNIIPFKVIELQVDNKELANRATQDRYSPERILPLHDSAQIFAVKLSAWQSEIGAIREWYQREHSNWVALPGERSKWWLWNSAHEIAKNTVVHIQTYLERMAKGEAASIADMCITPHEFSARLGVFGHYCPVSLALKNELYDCSTEPLLQYAAEFRGHYYRLAGPEELKIFLQDPKQFVPPLAPRRLPRPEMLPRRRTGADVKAMFPKAIELQGYCPVTFLDGKQRYEAIVPGNPELIAEYRDKLFSMETEEKLKKFMRSPEKYWDLMLPHKLPPKKEPLNVNGLPMLGYLEQTVAQVLTKALTVVGNFKPKYPFMSATQSALVYLALQLKAINPNSTDYVHKKYKRKLLQFEETCELITYLGNKMTRRYQEPKERAIDFDFKLDKFMQLQTTKATNQAAFVA